MHLIIDNFKFLALVEVGWFIKREKEPELGLPYQVCCSREKQAGGRNRQGTGFRSGGRGFLEGDKGRKTAER
jgi:hypothetical protein